MCGRVQVPLLSGCLSIHPYIYSYEWDLFETPWGNFITSGTSFHLDWCTSGLEKETGKTLQARKLQLHWLAATHNCNAIILVFSFKGTQDVTRCTESKVHLGKCVILSCQRVCPEWISFFMKYLQSCFFFNISNRVLFAVMFASGLHCLFWCSTARLLFLHSLHLKQHFISFYAYLIILLCFYISTLAIEFSSLFLTFSIWSGEPWKIRNLYSSN